MHVGVARCPRRGAAVKLVGLGLGLALTLTLALALTLTLTLTLTLSKARRSGVEEQACLKRCAVWALLARQSGALAAEAAVEAEVEAEVR